ncbi:MAG: thermonuclease family protein [Pontixanthobacter sp.]
MFRLFIAAIVLGLPTSVNGSNGSVFDAHFAQCGSGKRVTCIVDGDTFWLNGTKIRIADINTPEVSHAACSAERDLGHKATSRMRDLLNSAPFTVERGGRDEDRYGRKLRIISRDGVSLGSLLVDEGLAEPWTGRRRNWC